MTKKADMEIRNVNVYDYRYLENLYYILSTSKYIGEMRENQLSQKKAAVIVNLYYLDDAHKYFERLLNVPSNIHLYIISSNSEICSQADAFMKHHNRMKFDVILKNNRGRDISALLVACKKYFFQYEYICFIHDKKSKEQRLDEETDIWIENMWENLLSSELYIANLFDKFNEDKDLGLLVPPEPIGKQMRAWYNDDSWGGNYELTEKLVNRLNLSCKIDKDKPPITLSTAFWCKSDALRKLLSYDWTYEDFPEEPMANDGTISHCIERSLAFVAQDAGYKTGMVMTDKYASFMFSFLQGNIQNTFRLVENLNIRNFSDVDHGLNLLEFCNNNSRVYLYGSGKIGKMVLTRMRAFGIKVDGFVISNKTNEPDEVESMPVVEFATIKDYSDVGIIISVGIKLKNTIEKLLNDAGFLNYIYWKNDVE